MTQKNQQIKTKKRGKGKNIISFDEETVTKDSAEKILSNVKLEEEAPHEEPQRKNKREKKKKAQNTTQSETTEIKSILKKTDQKPKKRKNESAQETLEDDTVEEGSTDPPTTQNEEEESIRSKKRRKHAQLLEEKKLKSDLALQQKSLNYLSMWKHSRSDWKFEKLKQIWLQQNMYDSNRIDEQFWTTVVDYFSSSKGQVRSSILKEALKIVDKEETEDSSNEEFQNKLRRARDIVQNLQE